MKAATGLIRVFALTSCLTCVGVRAELPPVGSDGGNLSRQPGLIVHGIVIDDGSLLTAQEQQALFADYTDRYVSIEELHQLRYQLSRLYFERGRVNSGVIIPDQAVEDGVVHYREIPGTIAEIEIGELKHLPVALVEQSLREGIDERSLDIGKLQTAMQLLQQHHMVERINAQIVPGPERGRDRLLVDVTESNPHSLSVYTDNYRSPSVGGEELVLNYTHQSLTGHGDLFDMKLSRTEGVKGGSVTYGAESRRGLGLQFFYAHNDSVVVENPFDDLDIQSEAKTAAVTFSAVAHRTLTSSVRLLLGAERKESISTLLGKRFSFTPGDRNGMTVSNVVTLDADYSRSRANDVFAMKVGVRKGLDKGSYTSFDELDFRSIRGQVHYTRITRFHDTRVTLRSMFQRADSPLLSVEKLPLGGSRTVRGYRENLLVRDNGVAAGLDWTLPVISGTDRSLSFTLFTDWAMSWDEDEKLASSDRESIRSIGVAVEWRPFKGWSTQFTYGHALDDGGSGDLQDRGIHFAIQYRML